MTAKSRLCAAIFASALLASANCAAQTPSREPEQDISYKTTELFAHGAYRFVAEQRFTKFPEDAEALGMEETLVILKDGREIERHEGWRWEVYSAEGFSQAPPSPRPGADITGDGIPDIVLHEYSGGAHCCSTYYIFELTEPLRVTQIYTGDSPLFFKQLDEGPSLEARIFDDNFAYWRASFANSAMPQILLRYRDGAYEPAPDLMRAPPPSAAVMAEWVKESRDAYGWDMATRPRGDSNAQDLGDAFLERVTQLVYEGHADLVPGFVDLAWPSAKPGKDDFIVELMECRIRHSSYWPTIAAINGLPADKPIGKCD